MSNPVALVVGYIPLLYPQYDRLKGLMPGKIENLASNIVGNSSILDLIQKHSETVLKTCEPCGILWDLDGDVPHLSLILDMAEEVYDHLLFWCEDKPLKWFSVRYEHDEESYFICLLPDTKQMIRRHKFNNAILADSGMSAPLPVDVEYELMCVPLGLKAKKSDYFDIFLSKMKNVNTVKFSLIDVDDVPMSENKSESELKSLLDKKAFVIGEFDCSEGLKFGKNVDF